MATRKGIVTFGLVSIPAELHVAARSDSLDVDLLHEADQTRISAVPSACARAYAASAGTRPCAWPLAQAAASLPLADADVYPAVLDRFRLERPVAAGAGTVAPARILPAGPSRPGRRPVVCWIQMLDNRSFALNDELNLVVYDRALARQLETVFTQDLAHAGKVEYRRWLSRGLIDRLLERLALPLQDHL